MICNVLPFTYRKRELCCREFIRLKVKDEENILHKLLESSVHVALRFCPLMYIRIMSKQLEREIFGYQLVAPYEKTAFNVVDSINVCEIWNSDVAVKGVITVYTDGSVIEGSVGYGACAAVLFPTVN